MTKVLIDGDILLYQVAAAAEEGVEFSNEVVAAWVDIPEAKKTIASAIEKILSQTKTKHPIICFTDKTNFRKEIFKTYKANRVGIRKPVAFGPLKDHMREEYTCISREGLEADDVLGILLTYPDDDPEWGVKRVMYSADKDLLQIPGLHWSAKDEKVVRITKADGDHQHWLQMLTGDRTDNYFGCPGIGPKKAEQLLDKAGDAPWPAIVSAYKKSGLTSRDALVQARVSRICRYEDYDHKRRSVKLWNPPKKKAATSISHAV
jgi:DNA polymerase-1